MKHVEKLLAFPVLLSATLFTACSNDNGPRPEPAPIPVQGAYILHEGTFGNDDASISYYSFQDHTVEHEVYQRNSGRALGSGANAMEQYGSKLYVTVTESDQLIIASAKDASHVGQVDIEKPRDIAFFGDKAFVSSYSGSVFVIDTASLSITKEIPVGRTPEQVVEAEGKIYVANSGWHDFVFSGGKHDNTVSVIDPVSLTETKKIKIADNVTQLLNDGNGHVLASSADIYSVADYSLIKAGKLHVIHTSDLQVDTLDFGIQLMATAGDEPVYVLSSAQGSPSLFTLSSSFELQPVDYFDESGIVACNVLGVEAESGDVWVGDAVDYSSAGVVYYWQKAGKKVNRFDVKIFPKAFVFRR